MSNKKKIYEKIFNEFLVPEFPWILNIEIVPYDDKVFIDCHLKPNGGNVRGINCELLIGRVAKKIEELKTYVGVSLKGWIRFYDDGKMVCSNPFSY